MLAISITGSERCILNFRLSTVKKPSFLSRYEAKKEGNDTLPFQRKNGRFLRSRTFGETPTWILLSRSRNALLSVLFPEPAGPANSTIRIDSSTEPLQIFPD